MFKFVTKKRMVTKIFSPLNGLVLDITDVKDQVFANKMMGDGIAIIPENSEVYAPIDGRILAFDNMYHAVGISSGDGIELIVHFGLDTVKYKDKGLKLLVENGQMIKKGEKIMEVDLDFFIGENVDISTPVLITNPVNFEVINKCPSGKRVRIGEVLFEVKKR